MVRRASDRLLLAKVPTQLLHHPVRVAQLRGLVGPCHEPPLDVRGHTPEHRVHERPPRAPDLGDGRRDRGMGRDPGPAELVRPETEGAADLRVQAAPGVAVDQPVACPAHPASAVDELGDQMAVPRFQLCRAEELWHHDVGPRTAFNGDEAGQCDPAGVRERRGRSPLSAALCGARVGQSPSLSAGSGRAPRCQSAADTGARPSGWTVINLSNPRPVTTPESGPIEPGSPGSPPTGGTSSAIASSTRSRRPLHVVQARPTSTTRSSSPAVRRQVQPKVGLRDLRRVGRHPRLGLAGFRGRRPAHAPTCRPRRWRGARSARRPSRAGRSPPPSAGRSLRCQDPPPPP